MTKRRMMPPTVDREVDEELAHHVEMAVRDLMAEGWSEADARAEAERRFGDMERVRADCRDLGTRRDEGMDAMRMWDELRTNVKHALRQLRRTPGFAALTILTLAVAIGANSAVFSVVQAVLLKPLPYPDSDELAVVWTRYLPVSGFDIDKFALSDPEWLDIREETRTMASVGAYTTGTRTLTGEAAAAERVEVAFVSGEIFETLGVEPALGRWISPDDDIPGGEAVTVLSHELWTNRYGADPTLIGRTIVMDGETTRVLGVMPRAFAFPDGIRAWQPLRIDRASAAGRGGHGIAGLGRLAEGATLDDLSAELEVMAARWAEEYEHNVGHYAWSQGLRAELMEDAPRRLLLLAAAVGLVLLIASANVANLLLVRTEHRQSEVAVRTALGAGSGRITRQLATESLVLAGISAVLGIGLAHVGVRTLVAMDPTALPRLEGVSMNASVLFFTVAVAFGTALLFGIGPAYWSGRHAAATVATSATRSVGGRRRSSLRRFLVAGEVALSLVVVILAGLVVRSFSALTSQDPGMNPDELLTFAITLPPASYETDEIVPMALEELLDGIRAVPGVTGATAATRLPFTGRSQWDFELDDRPERQEGDRAWNAGNTHVASDYFETMGIPILRGRGFTEADGRDAPLVAVVSESMVSVYWPGEDVVGKRIGYEMDDGVPWMTIVGVVADPVTDGFEAEPYPHVYVPQSQAGISTYFVPRSLRVAVRGAVEVERLTPGVRASVQAFDPDLPLYRPATMNELVGRSLASTRVTTNLLGLFALIALLLASVGIYGVIAYSVAARTREIGVRVALGAERGEITRMILAEGARPVLAGVVFGLGAAVLSTRLVESMLFGVEPIDPVTFSVLPIGLLALGTVASLLPALRATRIAPTEALRDE